QANQINDKIKQVKLERDHKLSELQQQKADLQSRSDEQIASSLEPVMKEGQRLEATLQERIGQTAARSIVFESANITIVETGIQIAQTHVSMVQRAVKERLDELEAETRERLQRDIEQIKMEID